MAQYAVVNNNIVSSVEDLDIDQYRERARSAQLIIDTGDYVIKPQVGWGLNGNRLVPPVAPTIDANYIKVAKVLPIKAFVDDMLASVISENILMGITQLGKTGAVLAFALRKVDVASSPDPIGLYASLTNLSLTISIDVIDYHIAHPETYADLSPFVTTQRLTDMKHKIQSFLGMPLT